MAKYIAAGNFISRKFQSLGWDIDQAARITLRECEYVEGMAEGRHPLSRRWCDDIDRATEAPIGSTWIQYQQEVSK